MSDKQCPRGHGPLVLTHETKAYKTYSCIADGCKYSTTVKTATGWAGSIGGMIIRSVIAGIIGAEVEGILHSDPSDFPPTSY